MCSAGEGKPSSATLFAKVAMIDGSFRFCSVRTMAIAVLALAYVTAACGGESSSNSTPSMTPPRSASFAATPTGAAGDESAFAASMLTTHADFPSDYRETQRATDASKNPVAGACGLDTAPGRSGSASSSDFLFDGETPAVSEVVTVFATEADAAASVRSAAARIACAIAAIDAGKFNAGDVELSGATSAPIEIEAGGDATAAFAVQAKGKLKSIAGAEVTAQYTMVFAHRGRVAYDFVARGTGNPVDLDSLSDVMLTAAQRIRQQP